MALVSIMLHLGMDSLNEYGVHPFWPWDNSWYYGDTLFIVEPLCWLATAPLLFSFRSRGARVLLAVVFAIGCAAVLAFHQSGGVWWALPVLVLFLILGGKLLTPGTAAILSCALVCIVIGVFSVARVIVSHRVETVAARLFPGAKTLDIVLSPSPAHPLCWDVMLLQSAGNEYVARLGQFSLKSGSTGTCARMLRGQGTAPLVTLQMPVISGLRWTHAFSMDTRDLVRLAASTCDTRRAASFLRAPFATETSKGWIIGDLRYDRELGPGFAELVFDARVSSSCENLVPWTAPRSDIGF
jgi:inner membrane protein